MTSKTPIIKDIFTKAVTTNQGHYDCTGGKPVALPANSRWVKKQAEKKVPLELTPAKD